MNQQETTDNRGASSRLRAGCYLLRYTPVAAWPQNRTLQSEGTDFRSHFDGTFRVHRQIETGSVTVSGDLYYHQPPSETIDLNDLDLVLDWPLYEPSPSQIPIFPLAAYRYYLRVVSLTETAEPRSSVRMRFELHEYTQTEQPLGGQFENRGCFFTSLSWSRPPRNYPSGDDFLAGEVRDAADTIVGFLTVGWISDFLRRAIIEIDRVSESEVPLNNGDQEDWKTVFQKAGWDMAVEESDMMVSEPSGESWSVAELHEAMLVWRTPGISIDREWRYHMLCVRRLDPADGTSAPLGIMYDKFAVDSNNIPREGVAISSHFDIPHESLWGKVKGLRLGAASAPYFRTAVHELGHALGLLHNHSGLHFMRQTPDIAKAAAKVEMEFPDNIEWSFSPEDSHWLKHAPDPFIRPGGIPWGGLVEFFYDSLDSPQLRPTDHLTIDVAALNESVPLGAPARVHVLLTNHGAVPVRAPATLSFKAGFVRGQVVDEAGVAREFRPLLACVDSDALAELPAGGVLEHSFTLLRGPQGALFPVAGVYRVEFEITWNDAGVRKTAKGSCRLNVSKPRNAAHETAARKILETPDALLTLVLAGDHLPEGMAALQAGLRNSVLRPHYAAIEARRLARRFKDRPADIVAAATHLDEATILTPSEIQRLALLVRDTPNTASRTEVMERITGFAGRATFGRNLMRFLDDN